jgi:hypothetical protein
MARKISFGVYELDRDAMELRTPEMVASGNGGGGIFGSPSRDGKLAYMVWSGSESIYQVSISDRGQKLGPTFQLPLHEAEFHNSPSLSHDGKWMAYVTDSPGKPYSVVLRNLATGAEHLLDDKGLQRNGDVTTSISPDGSTASFNAIVRKLRSDISTTNPCRAASSLPRQAGRPNEFV